MSTFDRLQGGQAPDARIAELEAEVARLSRRPDLTPDQSLRAAVVCEGAWFIVGRGLRDDQAAIVAALRAAADREQER